MIFYAVEQSLWKLINRSFLVCRGRRSDRRTNRQIGHWSRNASKYFRINRKLMSPASQRPAIIIILRYYVSPAIHLWCFKSNRYTPWYISILTENEVNLKNGWEFKRFFEEVIENPNSSYNVNVQTEASLG